MANNAKHPQVSLLLTRPSDAARAFLSDLPIEITTRIVPILSPLMSIKPLHPKEPVAKCAVFTSAQAVGFASLGDERSAFCVGQKTASAAQARGWRVTYTAHTADDLVTFLKTHTPQDPLIHFAGVHTRGDVAQRLTAAGVPTRHIALYDQNLHDLNSQARIVLDRETPVVVPLFSPRTARHFDIQNHGKAPLHIIALSAAVAEALNHTICTSISVCALPTRQDMVKQLKKRVLSMTLG